MNNKIYEFEALIKTPDDLDGGYVEVPFDIKKEFGKGRLLVHAAFDNEPYDGCVVNMGLKNEDGSICYVLIVNKAMRMKIGKNVGQMIKVTIRERIK